MPSVSRPLGPKNIKGGLIVMADHHRTRPADPTAPATAEIIAFHRGSPVEDYDGTAGDIFHTKSTPGHPAAPSSPDRSPPAPGSGERDVPDPDQRRRRAGSGFNDHFGQLQVPDVDAPPGRGSMGWDERCF